MVPYDKCLSPPDPAASSGSSAPCREGGAVCTIVTSLRFALKIPGGSRNKRIMVFYTPLGLHGPAMRPARDVTLEPSIATLANDFVEASRSCVHLLDSITINLSEYGQCIETYFESSKYPHHTGLRGMAIVPQVHLLGHYSKPGLSVPAGHLYTLPIPFPRIGGDPQNPFSVHLWIVANAPVLTGYQV